MESPHVEIAYRAYVKMVLHAAKYPHCAVNGLLLASSKQMRSQQQDNTGSPTAITFVDAIPLFHQSQGLTPMLEVALAQIEIMATSANKVIAGYYHANEIYDDTSVDVFSQRIADAVAVNNTIGNGTAVLLTMDNRSFPTSLQPPLFLLQAKVDGKWERLDYEAAQTVESGPKGSLTKMLDDRLQTKLYDFDNHLDDLTKDFLNVELNMEIDKYGK